MAKYKAHFPEWRLDSFPGFLGNVTAGRCSNVFNLDGMNCVVDAACASSLVAIKALATSSPLPSTRLPPRSTPHRDIPPGLASPATPVPPPPAPSPHPLASRPPRPPSSPGPLPPSPPSPPSLIRWPQVAIDELLHGDCRTMVAGATCTDCSIGMYMAFSKTPVFSHKQSVTAYDETANGMLIGEGSVMFVLKKLEDALADGDTVHAVIRGCASSSDGKAPGIYAPTISGQVTRETLPLRSLTPPRSLAPPAPTREARHPPAPPPWPPLPDARPPALAANPTRSWRCGARTRRLASTPPP